MARFLGVWNCSHSRSRAKSRYWAVIDAILIELA
jgi:hypothetical protein